MQAKLKYYENLPSNSSGNQLAQTSQPPPPAPTSITSVQPEPDYDNNDDIVYNKSINTYRNVVFSNHDELRPGFIPVENVASDNMYIYDIKNSTVTSTLHLSRLSSSDELLIGINPYNSPNDFVDFMQVYLKFLEGIIEVQCRLYHLHIQSDLEQQVEHCDVFHHSKPKRR